MSTLIGRIIKQRKAPKLGEITGASLNLAKDLVTKPRRTIKYGLMRDKYANQALRLAGSSRGKLIKDISSNVARSLAPEVSIGAGGLLGSMAGGAIGGVPGALAGDYLGTLSVHKGLGDIAITRKVLGNLQKRKAFRKASPFRKVRTASKMLIRDTVKNPTLTSNLLTNEGAGFIAGNLGDKTPIPLGGFAAAIPTAQPIAKGIRRTSDIFKKTGNIREGIRKGVGTASRLTRRNISGRSIIQPLRRKGTGYLRQSIPKQIADRLPNFNRMNNTKEILFTSSPSFICKII